MPFLAKALSMDSLVNLAHLAYGTCSNFYTTETARYVAAHLPQARLSLYEGADHCPHLLQPQRFTDELFGLLDTA